MVCFRRVRLALLLALGFALLPSSSAWSHRAAVGEQVAPHGEEGFEYFSGGGAPMPQGICAEPGDERQDEFRADLVKVAAPSLQELVRSVWLVAWKTAILP